MPFWDANAIWFAAAMASAAVAIVLSQLYHQDFKPAPYDEASRLLFAVPVYLALRTDNFRILKLLEHAFPLGAIAAFLAVGLDPYHQDAARLGSYFLNVIHFGDLALMLGLLSFFSINPGRKNSVFSLLLKFSGMLAGSYLSIESGSRGGWLAALVLLALWIMYANNGKTLTKAVAMLGFALAAVVAYAFVDVIHQRVVEVYNDLSAYRHGDRDTSIGLRIQIWQAALYVIMENSLFGAGTEGYRQTILMLSKAGAITSVAREFATAEMHNQILSYSVKYGAFGLLSILAVYFVPLVLFVRSAGSSAMEQRSAGTMGICLVVGFLIFGLTVEIFNLKNTITFYSLSVASLLAAAHRPGKADAILTRVGTG